MDAERGWRRTRPDIELGRTETTQWLHHEDGVAESFYRAGTIRLAVPGGDPVQVSVPFGARVHYEKDRDAFDERSGIVTLRPIEEEPFLS